MLDVSKIQWSEGPQGCIFRNTAIRGVHRQKSGINLKASDWHRWSWLTRVTLTVRSSCCPPSLPPSCLTQLMSKAGFSTKEPVWSRRKHHAIFFLGRNPSSYFLLAISRPWQTGHNWVSQKDVNNHFIILNYIELDLNEMLFLTDCKVPSLLNRHIAISPVGPDHHQSSDPLQNQDIWVTDLLLNISALLSRRSVHQIIAVWIGKLFGLSRSLLSLKNQSSSRSSD